LVSDIETRIVGGSENERPGGQCEDEAGRIAGQDAAAKARMRPMPLQRIAWIVTAGGFLLAGLILLLSGYQGYAAVSAAVAASAAINLR
jgi:hypothetical protein